MPTKLIEFQDGKHNDVVCRNCKKRWEDDILIWFVSKSGNPRKYYCIECAKRKKIWIV